jgi:hypothetical protein
MGGYAQPIAGCQRRKAAQIAGERACLSNPVPN